ncbi:MAG: indole-3-glycerol phosphate synthase TrpC [Gemmataceae bacterium]|nr:indole-3-glycerol phosphate synthase TrpC [Gemmataceae bacterium]
MSTILDEIVAAKRREIAERQTSVDLDELRRRAERAPAARNFRAALTRGPGLGVIAEVKKASPSAGVLRADFDPVAVARAYEAAGADCLSVLTDGPYFQGDLAYLATIRAVCPLPLLRKDFLLDPYQVFEARAAGADAVLLIAEILDDAALRGLLALARDLGMEALVELHDPANLPRVLEAGATLVGINNRDLRTFHTSLERTLQLAPRIPSDRVVVSESGIKTRGDMEQLRAVGVKAVLIGETLMRADDPTAALRRLRGLG